MANDIPTEVRTFKARTRRLYLSWWVTHYAVGVFGIVAGTLLSASGEGPLAEIEGLAWVLGITAAICTSMVTFLGPLQKAQRYWQAWHLLDHATMEYEQGMIGKRTYFAQVKRARQILQAIESLDSPALEEAASLPDELKPGTAPA